MNNQKTHFHNNLRMITNFKISIIHLYLSPSTLKNILDLNEYKTMQRIYSQGISLNEYHLILASVSLKCQFCRFFNYYTIHLKLIYKINGRKYADSNKGSNEHFFCMP